MTKEQQLSMLEAICNNIYQEGKSALGTNKDPKERVRTMVTIAGAFMGSYKAYLKLKDGQIDELAKEILGNIKRKS